MYSKALSVGHGARNASTGMRVSPVAQPRIILRQAPLARSVPGVPPEWPLVVSPGCDATAMSAKRHLVVIVSNHPLGGLDGMILADMVSSQYGGRKDIRFVVNDLLDFVTPLRNIFVGVNKHGDQSRSAAAQIDEAFASDMPDHVSCGAGIKEKR